MMECIRGSIKNILRKKLRSSLTIIGIGIGVLSVVIISIIGDMGKIVLNKELSSMGIGGICIRANNGGENVSLDEKQLKAVQEDGNVFAATPLMTSVTNVITRSKSTQCILWGIDSNAEEIVSLKLIHGKMINSADINLKKKVCLVDEAFAQERYKRSNIVGKKIQVKLEGQIQLFEVVGVVESGGSILQGLMGNMVPTFVYAPFTTILQLSQKKGFTQIVAKLNDGADEAIATTSVVKSISKRLQSQDKVVIENLNQQKEKLNNMVDAVTLVLAAIGGISLLVAGISIMTVMLVTVNERTREIGIKKSIGATRMDILMEFLTEALILSLIGSIIGAIAGIALSIIGALLFHFPLTINFSVIFVCIGFCVGSGMLFGAYPAVKAAKLRPVDALRQD